MHPGTMRLLRATPARQHFSCVCMYYVKAVNLFHFLTQLNSRKAKSCVYVMITTSWEKMAKTRVHNFFICLLDACQFPVSQSDPLDVQFREFQNKEKRTINFLRILTDCKCDWICGTSSSFVLWWIAISLHSKSLLATHFTLFFQM